MRGVVLESRTSVLVVLEKAQLAKVDKVAGLGNRSSYIRWLIDTIDEGNLKREIELEAMNRMLQKLPRLLDKKIVARDLKIAELKNRIHAIKEGKPEEEVVDLDSTYRDYIKWRENRQAYGMQIGGEAERKWGSFAAQQLGMVSDDLVLAMRKRYRFDPVNIEAEAAR